jgi:protein-tyrosine phosphatase
MHCHIVPGVDDGARTMAESLAMLDAAVQAGVTEIVCTPHCRRPYFDFDAMQESFAAFAAQARRRYPHVPVSMGFEVNLSTLRHIGFDWAAHLGFEKARAPQGLELGATVHEFLLELPVKAAAYEYADIQRDIFALQGRGYEVIIAHPERYEAIQEDISIAQQLVDMGCKLQASAEFVAGGRLGTSKRPAIRMMKEGLYSYIASDAHSTEHYKFLAKACKKYSRFLRG